MHYFSIFIKYVNKLRVNFLLVWTKNANSWEILTIFDENSIEKLNVVFGKFVTKNRAFGTIYSGSEGKISTLPIPWRSPLVGLKSLLGQLYLDLACPPILLQILTWDHGPHLEIFRLPPKIREFWR